MRRYLDSKKDEPLAIEIAAIRKHALRALQCKLRSAAAGIQPIPVLDSAIITGVEKFEIDQIAKLYNIGNDPDEEVLISRLYEMMTMAPLINASMDVLKGMKKVPGINIAAELLNGIVAGCVVAIIGEITQGVFEQIYLGNKTAKDIDWVNKVMNANVQQIATEGVENLKSALDDKGKVGRAEVVKIVENIMSNRKGLPE